MNIALILLLISSCLAYQHPIKHGRSPWRDLGKNGVKVDGKTANDYWVKYNLPLLNYSSPMAPKKFDFWAGNVDVGKEGSLYFQLFGAQVETNVLLLSFNGGPGCSSMYSSMTGSGPVGFNDAGEYEWATQYTFLNFADVIYLDQPIGTGFALAKSKKDIPTTIDECADHFGIFIRKFFKLFPELRKRDFYITTGSYGGVWGPYFAKSIIYHNEKHPDERINLKGMQLNNGVIWPLQLYRAWPRHMESKGFLTPTEPYWDKIWNLMEQCEKWYREKDEWIHVQVCEDMTPYLLNVSVPEGSCRDWYDPRRILKGCDPLGEDFDYLEKYLGRRDVQHVINAKVGLNWTECDDTVEAKLDINPSVPSYRLLPWILSNNISLLLSTGVEDLSCATMAYDWGVGNMTWAFQTGLTLAPKPYLVNGKLKGEIQQRDGLTLLKIYDKGHMWEGEDREASYQMMKSFVNLPGEPPLYPVEKARLGIISVVMLMGIAVLVYGLTSKNKTFLIEDY